MDTLVLNADWRPYEVVSWREAMSLLFRDSAYAVVYHDGREVRSAAQSYPVPSVVVLKAYATRKRNVRFSRHNIYRRDNFECLYCGASALRKEVLLTELTFDHVVPRAQGGPTTWENIATCCLPCNLKKGSRTPAQARMPLLRPPYLPKVLGDAEFLLRRQGVPEAWAHFLGNAL